METASACLSIHPKEQREQGKKLQQGKVKEENKKKREKAEALAKLGYSKAVGISVREGWAGDLRR